MPVESEPVEITSSGVDAANSVAGAGLDSTTTIILLVVVALLVVGGIIAWAYNQQNKKGGGEGARDVENAWPKTGDSSARLGPDGAYEPVDNRDSLEAGWQPQYMRTKKKSQSGPALRVDTRMATSDPAADAGAVPLSTPKGPYFRGNVI
jgi:hypothetical protein